MSDICPIPDEPGSSGTNLFACPTEVCSPYNGDLIIPGPSLEAEWFCSFGGLAENEPKLHSLKLNDISMEMIDYYYIQSGYPCRKVRVSTSSKYMDDDEGVSFGPVSECELKPPEYFESCKAALAAWSDGDQDNPQTLLSCVDPNNWFEYCQLTPDLQCPVPVEPGEAGEDCGN